MYNRILQLMVFLSLFLTSSVYAQKYQEMIEKGTYSVFEIQKEAEKYFEVRGTGQGTGYKQYKRWEYNALREMNEQGFLPDEYQQYEELQRFQKEYQRKNKNKRIQGGNTTGNWKELGPNYWNRTSGWNPGVGRITSLAVDENNYNHMIIGANTGGVWRTIDKGTTWTPLSDNFSTMDVGSLAIDPKNSNTYYWGGNGGAIYKSTDAGTTWTKVANAGSSTVIRILIHPTNSNIMFAASNGFYKSTNAGTTWTKVSASTSGYDLEFKPNDPNTVYASGNGFYKSTDGGNTFTQITTGTGVQMIAVTPADANKVYVLEASGGKFGAFYTSSNSASSFTKITAHDGKNYFGYSTKADDQSGQAPRDMAIAASPSNANEVHIAGINTWRSTDGGNTFVPTSDWTTTNASNKNIGYCHADVDDMAFYGNTLYVITDGGIYIAENTANISKTYYKDLSTGLGIRQFYKIGVSQSATTVISGGSQDNGTSVIRGDGKWYDWLGADGMESFVDWNNINNLYGTSQNGSLYKSTNGGQSYSGITKPAGDGNWVTPFEQDPQVSTTIYSGYTQVYKSTNSGSGWTSISQDFGGNLNHLKIAKSDNKVMYAARGSSLYKTTTGSGTWATLSGISGTINYIAIHPTNPNKVAVVTTGTEKIYVSSNGGTTWTSYKKDLPSMTAYCAVWDDSAENGLYIGMTYGIYYINDSFTTWQPFMTGIPNAKVNELEINYTAKKIYAGTYGRGLWESDLYNANVTTNDIAVNSIITPNGAEICGVTTKTIAPQIELKNLGNETLTSATIKVELNGKLVQTYTYSGSLAFGKTQTITLATQTFIQGSNSLKISVSSPNGKTDENTTNDSQSMTIKVIDGTAYLLTVNTDVAPQDISWEFKNSTNQIVYQVSSNSSATAYAKLTQEVCLVNDCYTFTIKDAKSDGMKVGIVGSYQLTKVETSEQIFTVKGNEFTSSKVENFCASNIVYANDVLLSNLTNLPTSLCGNSISPVVTIKNLGTNTLTSLVLKVYSGAQLLKTVNHTTSLTKGNSENVTIDVSLTGSGTQTIKIVAENPNGKTDENPANNEQQGSTTITIGSLHEFYISERSMNSSMKWVLLDKTGKTIQSGDATKGTTNDALKITEMCIADACYDLKVTDAFSAGGCTVEAWVANTEYCGGVQVSHKGIVYQSDWCNKNEPGTGQWIGWTEIGACNVVYDTDVYGFRKTGSTTALTETTVKGYVSPKTQNICIGTPITVDFIANKTTATQCDTITFTANVTGNATSYAWNFGDGKTATGVGPHKIAYQTIGQKTVVLTVNGTEVKTKTNYITLSQNTALQPTIQVVLTKGTNPSCETDELILGTKGTNIDKTATYKWFLNQNQIATTPTFVYKQFQHSDKVSVEVTTNSACLSVLKATSVDYIVQRTKNVLPSVVIETLDLPACKGNVVTFTTTSTNEGTSPIYTWFIDSKQVGTGTSLSIDTLQNLQNVTCNLTSNAVCATQTTVTSNQILAEIDVCTGELTKEFAKIQVYPNPTNSKLNIELGSLAGQEVKWTLYNTYGQILHIGNQSVTKGFVHTIDMTSMSSGAYFLKIETATNSTVIKVEKN